MKDSKKHTVWTIAGIDPSNGAGIHQDLLTFSHLNVSGYAIETALTEQSDHQFIQSHYLPVSTITDKIHIFTQKAPPNAIKLGMLGTACIEVLNHYLTIYQGPVILDPLLFSSTQGALFDGTLENYIQHLRKILPKITVLTPNIQELETLSNTQIQDLKDIPIAAQRLIQLGAKNIFVKGGHFLADNKYIWDYWTNGTDSAWFSSPRIPNKKVRGTGCALSSALAASLALGYRIQDACVIAKMYVNRGIRLAQNARLHHAKWPEEQLDLPYVSSHPILKEPESFAPFYHPGLYAIVDSYDWVQKLVKTDIDTIQIRIKNKTYDNTERHDQIRKSIEISKNTNKCLFVNDYWELALKLGAKGVHLGQSELPHADIELLRKSGVFLGISTHNYFEVATAHAYKPSYIACGTIFPTKSKTIPFEPQGLEGLKKWRRLLNYPLVAIGGINTHNITDVWNTGIDGVAMISAITQADNPAQRIEKLQNKRYTHQTKLQNFGTEGQHKLSNARVLCVGAGGLGCAALPYLVGAGIGHITIMDDDTVDISNLQRQILYKESHIGKPKAQVASEQLKAQNSTLIIEPVFKRLTEQNAEFYIQSHDLILDCSDNFYTKYTINKKCCDLGKPHVFSSVSQFSGYCTVFWAHRTPCLNCLFPTLSEENLDCANNGILGPIVGIMGCLQAAQAIQYFLSKEIPLAGKLLTLNLLNTEFNTWTLRNDPHCTVCSKVSKL